MKTNFRKATVQRGKRTKFGRCYETVVKHQGRKNRRNLLRENYSHQKKKIGSLRGRQRKKSTVCRKRGIKNEGRKLGSGVHHRLPRGRDLYY